MTMRVSASVFLNEAPVLEAQYFNGPALTLSDGEGATLGERITFFLPGTKVTMAQLESAVEAFNKAIREPAPAASAD